MGEHDYGALAEIAVVGVLLILGVRAIAHAVVPPAEGHPVGTDPFGVRSGIGGSKAALGAQSTGLLTYRSNPYAGDQVAM